MGKRFDVVYDDFTGGHYVGPQSARQPRDTWTGDNVVCTSDEGMLMACGGWGKSDLVVSSFANSSAPLYLYNGTNAGVTFSVGTSVYRVASSGITVTTVAAGTLGFTPSADSHPALTDVNGTMYGATTATTAHVNHATGAITTSATNTAVRQGVWKWKNWLLHLSSTYLDRIYFSDPSALTWGAATNYIDIGDVDTVIEALVTTADELLVGTRQGWWSVTGVLGETTTVRKLTKVGLTHATAASVPGAAAESESLGIISSIAGRYSRLASTSGRLTTAIHSGLVPDDVAYDSPFIVNAGPYLLVAAWDRLWVWSELARNWRVVVNPYTTDQVPVEDAFSSSDYLWVLGREGGDDVYVNRTLKDPIEPVQNGASFDSATVTLAPYHGTAEFRVHSLIVEVDYGFPAARTAPRSVSASVAVTPPADLDVPFTSDSAERAVPLASTTFTQSLGSSPDSRRGHRRTVTFAVNDAGHTYTATPQITMTGVKVRRVIMRCEEA